MSETNTFSEKRFLRLWQIVQFMMKAEVKRVGKQKLVKFLKRKECAEEDIIRAYIDHYTIQDLYELTFNDCSNIGFELSIDESNKYPFISKISSFNRSNGMLFGSSIYEIDGVRSEISDISTIHKLLSKYESNPFYIVLKRNRTMEYEMNCDYIIDYWLRSVNLDERFPRAIIPLISKMEFDKSLVTPTELQSLDINSIIDYREDDGRFILMSITAKTYDSVTMECYDQTTQKSIECNVINDKHRFAKAGSQSVMDTYERDFPKPDKEDFIDINPLMKGWKIGKIKTIKRGQIRVAYWCDNEIMEYWTHFNNTDEVAEFQTHNFSEKEIQTSLELESKLDEK